jgi:hypothetical protein
MIFLGDMGRIFTIQERFSGAEKEANVSFLKLSFFSVLVYQCKRGAVLFC